jgi:WhiB family redox-sensing transcriptional regulator
MRQVSRSQASGTFDGALPLHLVMDTQPPPEVEQPWMIESRCREYDPAVFFPSDGVGVEVAQRICAQCSVRRECLEYALTYRIDHGVWGGASERERRRILRSRRLARAGTTA